MKKDTTQSLTSASTHTHVLSGSKVEDPSSKDPKVIRSSFLGKKKMNERDGRSKSQLKQE